MLLRQYAVSTSCLSLWQFASGLLHVSGGVTHNQCKPRPFIHVHDILHLSLFLSLIFRRHISILCNLCNKVFFIFCKNQWANNCTTGYDLYGECNYIIPEMTRDGISSSQKLDIVSLYNSISYCINTILF